MAPLLPRFTVQAPYLNVSLEEGRTYLVFHRLIQAIWNCFLALPCTSCVTFSESLGLPVLQIPIYTMEVMGHFLLWFVCLVYLGCKPLGLWIVLL